MKSSMRIENPKDVEVTLALTMTVDAWARLREALDKAVGVYPRLNMIQAIDQMVREVQARVHYEPPQEDERA